MLPKDEKKKSFFQRSIGFMKKDLFSFQILRTLINNCQS